MNRPASAPTPPRDRFRSYNNSADSAVRRLVWARAHRPQRVLDAPGMTRDFYSQPVAWGTDMVCAALGSQVLLFDPERPSGMSSFTNTMSLTSEHRSQEMRECLAPEDITALDNSSLLGTPVEVSAVTFLSRLGASPAPNDRHVVVGDRRGRALLLTQVEGTASLLPSTIRCVPEAELCGRTPPWGLPNTFGITALHAHGGVVGMGFGTGVIELYDTRQKNARCACITIDPAMQPGSSTRSGFAPLLGVRALHSVTALCYSPDGACLASGHNDGTVRIWSLAKTSEPVAEVKHIAGGVRCSWSPCHRGIIATCGGSLDGVLAVSNVHQSASITVGNPNSGTLLSLATSTQITAVEWTDDSAFLVTAHGFSFEELSQHAPPTPAVAARCEAMETVAVPGRSVAVWSVPHLLPLSREHSPASRFPWRGQTPPTPITGTVLPQPLPRPSRTDSFRVPLAPKSVYAANNATSSFNGYVAQPKDGIEPKEPTTWATVEVSPPLSPVVDTLSVARTRMNRLDLMPLVLQGADDDEGALTKLPRDGLLPSTYHSAAGDYESRTSSAVSGVSDDAVMVPFSEGLSLVGTLLGHVNRPLQVVRRGRATGQFLTASGGDGDETLRFWAPFRPQQPSSLAPTGTFPLGTKSFATPVGGDPCFDSAVASPDFSLR